MELSPCPFCGGDPTTYIGKVNASISCLSCDYIFQKNCNYPYGNPDPAEAMRKLAFRWNKRTLKPTIPLGFDPNEDLKGQGGGGSNHESVHHSRNARGSASN